VARVTSSRELLKNNINDYLIKGSQDWATLLQGTPVFATYYSKDRLATTEDQGLDTVMETIGSQSPVKYNRIAEFMLFGLDSLETTIEASDWGPTTEYQGTAIVIPDTIHPLTDDYFTFEAGGDTWLFRVSDSQPDKIHGKKFWKISFYLSSESIPMLEEAVKESFSLMPASNANVEGKPAVIRLADSVLVDQADMVLERLTGFYVREYVTFNRYGVPLMPLPNDGYLYDQSLVHFVQQSKALYQPGSFRLSAWVEDALPWTASSLRQYNRTIYAAVEREQAWDMLTSSAYRMSRINVEDRLQFRGRTPFHGAWEKYYLAEYDGLPSTDDPYPALLAAIAEVAVPPAPLLLLPLLDPVQQVVAGWVRGKFLLTGALLDALDAVDPVGTPALFHLLPCAIYAIRTARDRIAKKQTIA
jgi:hypothetical protein